MKSAIINSSTKTTLENYAVAKSTQNLLDGLAVADVVTSSFRLLKVYRQKTSKWRLNCHLNRTFESISESTRLKYKCPVSRTFTSVKKQKRNSKFVLIFYLVFFQRISKIIASCFNLESHQS